jgi:hypothetical protein
LLLPSSNLIRTAARPLHLPGAAHRRAQAPARRAGVPPRRRSPPGHASLFPLPSKVPVTCSSPSMQRPWFPPEAHPDTGRLCSAGSGATRSPTSSLLCSPPTPAPASASASVVPCTSAYPRRRLLLCGAARAASAGRACLRGRAARRGVVTGSPLLRTWLVDRCGSPRCLGRPLRACRGPGPRRIRRPLAHVGDADAAEKRLKTPGTRDQTIPGLTTRGSRVRTPTHRPGTSPRPGARLATGLLGSALAGRASHPLDDVQDFVNLPLAYSFLTSLAWSHSTRVRSPPRVRPAPPSSSPGGSRPRGPPQIRTRRFPPSGSSAGMSHGAQSWTTMRGRGSGKTRKIRSLNRSQFRRVRWLRLFNHLYQARVASCSSLSRLRPLPLIPK